MLDANEYIFAFGPERQSAPVALLRHLSEQGGADVCICRTIVQEVVPNLGDHLAKAFFGWMGAMTGVDEDEVVPFMPWHRYEAQGFKPADAFIAAYAEYMGAEVVVSENRHFLRTRTDLPFRVLDAAAALKVLRA